jgi:hypothetical protein
MINQAKYDVKTGVAITLNDYQKLTANKYSSFDEFHSYLLNLIMKVHYKVYIINYYFYMF